MNMRAWIGALLFLAACGSAELREPPEDPSALAIQLGDADPLRREEAAQRLARLGTAVHEVAAAETVDPDTEAMGAAVASAVEIDDPERTVWAAWHALRRGCLARDWKRLSGALARQGFRLTEIYEPHERAKFVRFLAKGAAHVDGGGTAHDLFFWVQSVRRGETGWLVREVYVGLHASFEAPYKQVAGRNRYRRGSVLDRFLEMAEVKRLAAVFPVVEELELTYGRIRDKEAVSVPAGFHVNAGFALVGEKGGGRGIAVTVESDLDPRETPGGRFLWDDFAPSGTMGPPVVRGGSFWGAGGLKPSDD